MMQEWVYITAISALWAILWAVVAFLISRLTRAIDRLTENAQTHTVRLTRIETAMRL